MSGSAGTGKTIVALHRAVHLARAHPDARVLLATFSETLANALRGRLRLLIGNEPRIAERLETLSMSEVGLRLYEANFGAPNLATDQQVQELLKLVSRDAEIHRFSDHFLWTEWVNVVDAWQLETWDEYRDVKRLGRKTRLAETQRKILWSIFEKVRSSLRDQTLLTEPELFGRLAQKLENAKNPAFDFAVIDEAQDVGVAELRFLAALGAGRANSLFFAGDLGQRIFQQPFSWKALGVEIQGRSKTLRINYRTSHQIRKQADRLLAPELSDVDGNTEDRRGAISVFNGPEPVIELFETEDEESQAVAEWIRDRLSEKIEPHEIAVFVRSVAEFLRAKSSAELIEAQYLVLDERMQAAQGRVVLTTMHLAKGLEFRAVVVMACDDEVIPLQARIESVSDAPDLEDVYQTERHLLYVACTRARDHLLVTGVNPGSEFLEDLRRSSPQNMAPGSKDA